MWEQKEICKSDDDDVVVGNDREVLDKELIRHHQCTAVGRDKRPLDFVAFHTLRKTFVSLCVFTFCIILCSLPYFEFYCGHLTTPQGMPVSVGGGKPHCIGGLIKVSKSDI